MWAQKARSTWVIQGDRNTQFFLPVVKQRRAKSCIIQLKNTDGSIIENPKEIECILVSHFKHQFQSTDSKNLQYLQDELTKLPVPKLSQHMKQCLESPITDAEIKNVVFMLGAQKALVLMAYLPSSIRNLGALSSRTSLLL